MLQASMEADRQLGLQDLLGTALHLCDRSGSAPSQDSCAWCKTIVALADARARQLRPSAVALRRLGVRAWSGIGLSAALVLVIAAISWQPQRTRAAGTAGTEMAARAAGEPAFFNSTATSGRRTRVAAADRIGPSARDLARDLARGIEGEVDSSASRPQRRPGDDPAAAARTAPPNPANAQGTGADGSGRGVGAAQNDQTAPARMLTADTTLGRAGGPSGRVAGGGGAADASAAAGATVTGAMRAAKAAAAGAAAAPWSAQGSAAQRDPAGLAGDGEGVPDAYRDLVRAYFTPEP
jgi:hypothetical protein